MRFEAVTAYAFGPFSGRALRLAPGLNVIYGPNEAGKSTWHAALFAGLCGMRRGRGAGRAEDRDFAARHRPWDGAAWEVGVVVALEDGRRIELRHDLNGRVDCRATDATLGRDCSAEILYEGAPDGSRWLGLDRRSFLAIACVRQADLLGILDEPGILQEHLQRAAATSGTDATAASALERIERFQRDQVGQDRPNSYRPLRQARLAVETARQALAQAQADHASYLALAAQAKALEEQACAADRELWLIEARRAITEADAWARRCARAQELAARFPDGPPADLAPDDELAQRVAAVLRAWEGRPEIPVLAGSSALDLQRQIETLPDRPAGDLEPHPSVVRAGDELRAAQHALRLHQSDRPIAPDPPATGGASVDELRDLARDLAAPEPRIDPDLRRRRERAQERLAAASRQPRRPIGFVVAGLLVIGGVVAAGALGLLIPGLVLALAGVAALGWTVTQSGAAARAQALEELRAIEAALGGRQHAADEVARRRQAARERVAALGLPADPQALQRFAQAAANAAQTSRDLARWEAKRRELIDQVGRAHSALVLALQERGAAVADATTAESAQEALAGYERACRERAELAAQAALRPALERRLADRRKAEALAAEAVRRRRQAEVDLRAVAERCGLPGDDEAALAAGMRARQEARRQRLERRDAAQREWAELENLLAGRTPADLAAEAVRRAETAARLAEGLDGAALSATRLDDDAEAQLAHLREAARQAHHLWRETRGQVGERARALRSVPDAEEALARAQAELARLEQLDRTLTLTRQFLEAAQDRVHRDVAPVLAASVRRWLPDVTAGRYQEVRVDPQTLDVWVSGEGGRWRRAALLSHGTAEQIYLLLRVAMADHLTKPGELCPLILDDITVHTDGARTEAVLRILQAISRRRQVILFSQEEDVLAWAEPNLHHPIDRVERLDPALVGV